MNYNMNAGCINYSNMGSSTSRINYRRNYNRRDALKQRRTRICQMQKTVLVMVAAFFLIIAGVMFGSNLLASSNSNASNEAVLYKYYTSIEVQSGDTLWTIADQYLANNEEEGKSDYIDEVIAMNQLADGTIHAGDYITVPYYSYDFK